MNGYRLTRFASDDLRGIVRYLVLEAGQDFALRVEDELFKRLELLSQFPGLGHRRPDLTKRFFVFFTSAPYHIVYDPVSRPIVVHAILHSARDVKRLLRGRS